MSPKSLNWCTWSATGAVSRRLMQELRKGYEWPSLRVPVKRRCRKRTPEGSAAATKPDGLARSGEQDGIQNPAWCLADSGAESFCGASLGFGGLFFSILWGCVGFEGREEASGNGGNFVDCQREGGFVGLGRFVETGDFSDELERSGSNVFGSDGRIKVEEGFDVPAHSYDLGESAERSGLRTSVSRCILYVSNPRGCFLVVGWRPAPAQSQ